MEINMPFAKGQSGNPKRNGGRKPGPSFRTLVEKIKKEHPSLTWEHPDYGTFTDPIETAIVLTWAAAMNGEPWALKELLDRGLGKPAATLAVEGDTPLAIIWRHYNDQEPKQIEESTERPSTIDLTPDSSDSTKALPASE
jgi:hypothetical protein